ncbi:unnamed protein product [Paramecium octaurelia]|uniref:Uncharacterized protein n=1 Tax=Paramecium octaurelia TaxID=43137 RepID=A0A8S1WYN3_PAROT|nr:unnamed protein product [Paramecium octaurelia]
MYKILIKPLAHITQTVVFSLFKKQYDSVLRVNASQNNASQFSNLLMLGTNDLHNHKLIILFLTKQKICTPDDSLQNVLISLLLQIVLCYNSNLLDG